MPEDLTLRAGPLQATFQDGVIKHVRAGEVELVQRIYCTVRDRNWESPAGRVANVVLQNDSRGFRLEFDSVHQEGDLDFRWHGVITGTDAGKLALEVDGKAHSTFLRNRIGVCVHHPLTCAGLPCVIETATGGTGHSRFPEFVEPHQPFLNVRALRYEIGGLPVEVRFQGDIFETEDHRNWTDANFKTYCTPLSLPFPVELQAGSEVHHRVEISVQAPVPAAEPATARLVQVRAGQAVLPMPRIGLAIPRAGRALSDAERLALRALRLSHLRVDISAREDLRPVLEQAAADAQAIGTKLEIAVTFPGDPRGLNAWVPIADRWLVFAEGKMASGSAEARALRQEIGPKPAVCVGTDANFAELNRNRPDGDGWDAASFSINPQVHVFDDETVMANTAAQYDAARDARRFLEGRAVAVSPVTLRPRPHPDPRQKLPFCAAWTVASLKALADAGAASVTYFETHGPGGVIDGGEHYPVYRVFEALAQVSGADCIPCEVSDSGRIAAIAFDSTHGRGYLLANLTPEQCEVAIEGAGTHVLEPYAVRLWRSEG
ncbi:MAG: hypothetical protein U0Q18_22280 [Bryobacteraceae bacterium]